jgi:RNA polymerase sigma factor (sigma-70 family)
VWVEADGPCEVGILGATSPTFEVEGHHFALVHVTGLPAEGNVPYEVAFDGERVWPPPDWEWPSSCVRTVADDHGLRIAFGSCRCAYPNEPPWTLTKDEDPEGRGHDALRALALRMRDQEPDEWPDLLLMLGDQVYADEVAPATEKFIRARRDVDVPPGLQISDFEEYCRLYRDAWCEPAVRWLLSTVPTAMIFDDHDVIDDWNTSRDWVAQMRATGWWDERIVGAFMSYWCYQHLGNLSPEDRDDDACYRAVCAAEGDAGAIVRDFAFRADREVAGARWSYKRDIGRTRIVVMDSRAGRVLEPGRALDGRRRGVGLHRGVDARRLRPPAAGNLAAGLPRARDALPGGLERGGRRRRVGRLASRAAERLRQGLDLEHWAAFGDSLRALERLLGAIASGRHGSAPGPSCCSPATCTTPTSPTRGPPRRAGVAGARLSGRLLADAQPPGRQRAARDQARDDGRRRAHRPRSGPRGEGGRRVADLGHRRRPLVLESAGHPASRRQALHLRARAGAGRRRRAADTRASGHSPPRVTPRRVCSLAGDRMDQGEAITTAARALREQELLRRIHEQGDVRARDQLAEEMLPLARALAGRYANRGEPLDDLVQVACIGIMKAIDGFDLTREVRFSSYATPTVPGRDQAPLPRQDVGHARPARPAGAAAARGQGARQAHPRARAARRPSRRSPTAVEAPFEEVLATIQSVSARRTRSLDEPTGEDVTLADSLGTVDPEIERAEMRALLDGAFDVLSDRDQEVLRLRFEHDLTQTEIAQRIGVSQMQVSRLIRQSLADADGYRALPRAQVANRLESDYSAVFGAHDAAGLQTGLLGLERALDDEIGPAVDDGT